MAPEYSGGKVLSAYKINCMTIRKCREDDITQLAVLFDMYRVFYKKNSDIEGATFFLRTLILNNASTIFIAVNSSNIIIGFVQLYPLYSSTRMKSLLLLNDLFVSPDYRGKGISKLLIEDVKKYCVEVSSCALILETAKNNIAANRLYKSTSFMLDEEHNYYEWVP